MTDIPTEPEQYADPASSSLPSEEEIARLLCEARSQQLVSADAWSAEMAHIRAMEEKHPTYITGFSTGTDALRQARAVLALIRPAFEAKEREIERIKRINADHCQAVNTLLVENSKLEARALAAEAKLAQAVEALEPFAKEADMWGERISDAAIVGIIRPGCDDPTEAAFTTSDLRRARAASSAIQGETR